MCHSTVECGLLTGTRSADDIRASGHASRITDPMRVGDVPTRLPVALEARRIFAMLQTLDVHAPIDYDRTLILAIELSSKNWVLAAQVPGLRNFRRACYQPDSRRADGRH